MTWIRIGAYTLIGALGVSLLFFTVPNRLGHDQLEHKVFQILREDPHAFDGDYLMGNPKRELVNNAYAMRILDGVTAWTGSEELTRWVLLPAIFLIFTIGFFELVYSLTGHAVASVVTAVLANVHLYVFTAEWGLPGPSGLDPWVFYQAFTPWLFLAFYRNLTPPRHLRLLGVFAAAGLLGNLHIVSAFNFIGALILTYLIMEKPTLRRVGFAILTGAVSTAASAPFLLPHSMLGVNHITAFDPQNPAYLDAIQLTAPHTTLAGLWRSLTYWLVNEGYMLWPLVGALVLMRSWSRRSEGVHKFLRFGVRFIAATLIFNIGFTLLQLARFSIFQQLPFWNQPRGVQLIYLVLFPAVGFLIARGIGKTAAWFTRERRVAAIALGIIVTALATWVSLPWFAERYRRHMAPRYSFLTCDALMYRALTDGPVPPGTVLHDPDAWGAMRVCTRRAVVVQSRDRAFAYSVGSDMMLEWYRRYREVSQAFRGDGEELIRVATKYGARIIVSRRCTALNTNRFEQTIEVAGEGCIYVTKPIRS